VSATRSAGGFSLIEVLCAILILGVGIAGLTHGLNTALSSSKESELQTTAALLAAGRIETLRADGFVVDGVEEGDAGDNLPLYHWQQTITRSDIEGLHQVTVLIEEPKTGKAIYELRTLLFDPPSSLGAGASANPRDKSESRRKDRRSR